MSASVEASRLIQSLVGEVKPGTKVKTLIHRAAHILGWSDSRAFDVWYGKARRIDAEEMDALRQAAQLKGRDDAGRSEHKELLEHIREIKERLVQIEQELGRAQADAGVLGNRRSG